MLLSGAPGRIGLERETAGNGRTPPTGWFRLREIRRSRPREPMYATIAATSQARSRWMFTFHDRIEALRNRGSTVTGDSPIGRVVLRASARRIEPVDVNGTANGGLAVVSLTTVVLG